MTDPMTNTRVAVSEADRKAAASYYGYDDEKDLAYWGNASAYCDVERLARAFAAHRLANQPAGDAGIPESALIDALHISPKLSCDDRISILRKALSLAALTTQAADGGAIPAGRLPYRSQCDCPCHTIPGIMHVAPCCQPDTTASGGAVQP